MTVEFHEVEKAAGKSVDALGEAAAKTRKMYRRARTREEANKLEKQWLELIKLLEKAALANLRRIDRSAEMQRAIDKLEAVRRDLDDARRKMTSASKAIDQGTRVINLASELVGFFVPS